VGDVVGDVETGSITNSSQSCGHGLSGAAEHSNRGKMEMTGRDERWRTMKLYRVRPSPEATPANLFRCVMNI
jgi:hypothetical protein